VCPKFTSHHLTTPDGAEDHYNQSFGSGPSDIVDLWRTDGPAYGENGTYNDYAFTAEALRRIEKHNATEPLFLYMAYQNPHCPLEVPDRYLNYSIPDEARRNYTAMVAVLDESIGQLVNSLRGKGMFDDTLLVRF
jgi:arylsulfatase B/arylsulfatase I/J